MKGKMITLSNTRVVASAPAGMVIGVFNSSNVKLQSNPFGYFIITGTNLIVAWHGQATPGSYNIQVHASGGPPQTFSISITSTIPAPPPPPPPVPVPPPPPPPSPVPVPPPPPPPTPVPPPPPPPPPPVPVPPPPPVPVPPPPPPTPSGVQPINGVTGYVLSAEYVFGTSGNVKNIADLQNLFNPDAPWGRINNELETFRPFNSQNHIFEADNLALTGLADGSGNYTQYGHITSGALVSKVTCFAPCIVEVVAKLPAGRGVWPSIWLYDTHSGHNDDSEIDLMESQFNAPIGQRDDRSLIYQNDHGVNAGIATISNPGGLDPYGRWAPYGWGQGFMDTRFAAYSVLWLPDRVTKYVDNKPAITRSFHWTGPAQPNLLVYNSIGSDKLEWPGPVSADTFSGDNAKFRIKSIRIFKPVS